jgi:hypothetical protein
MSLVLHVLVAKAKAMPGQATPAVQIVATVLARRTSEMVVLLEVLEVMALQFVLVDL